MNRFGMILCVVAGCGERMPQTQPGPQPAPAATQPAATQPAAVVAARNPASVCAPVAPAHAGSADPYAAQSEPADGARRAAPEHGDRCEIADSNLARAEQAILAAPASAARAGKPTPWDHKRKLEYGALVETRLALQPAEKQQLERDGFVVPARLEFGNYARAFHEIYQSQLPLYVSVDAVLHAIYVGNDSLIADLEDQRLRPELASLLDALACALPTAAASYPDNTRHDLDLYLAVARALMRGDAPQSMTGDATVEAEARALVKQALAAAEMTTVKLFGRDRVIDFTAYTPRGHYAEVEERQRYFRAGMWLSRLELNLVSRSSRSSQPGIVPNPEETPREAVDALALADLIVRANQAAPLARLDTAWTLLAGRREDVSMAQLVVLARVARIDKLTDPDAAAKLRAAIGDTFQRTARLHYMPQGSPVLPAIATLLGPRIVPDAAATRPLVHDELPGRSTLGAADMAYVIGHDRALAYLGDARKQYPTLDGQLAKARAIVKTTPRGKDDLYSAWLDAVVGLAEKPTGVRSSFTRTAAYADLRLDSALAAFGHIKHNFVLIVGESYFAGGCEIPDGYVEPAPATYDALIDYAARGERAMAELDRDGKLGARAYFARLGQLLRVLRTIQRDELAGRALTADERAFLSMVAEMAPGTTGGPPTFTGWWFDLFRGREHDGLASADYIASFFTGEKISYIGATAPRLGVFVVDSNGPPRLMVGPVARAYEYLGPVAHRLDDAGGRALAEADRVAPWAASYSVAAPRAPALHLEWSPGWDGNGKPPPVTITTKDKLGPVTVEVFDHHRKAIARATATVGPGKTELAVKLPAKMVPEGVHLQVGAFHGWYELGIVEASVYEDIGGWHRDEGGD